MPFSTMAELKATNQARGNNWFDRATMKFWKSRIHGGIRGGKYFITSERDFRDITRFYSIREASEDGDIKTVGEFQAYRSLDAAREALRDILKATPKGGR